jgi:hypothetical protein
MKAVYLFLFLMLASFCHAQDKVDFIGRWDLTMNLENRDAPSWLEIRKSGNSTLVGRFVYASGSARPISEIEVNEGQFRFSIPPQWEAGSLDMVFSGRVVEGKLIGTMMYTDGKTYSFTGVTAPDLDYNSNPRWGKKVELFNRKDLTGWQATGENQWVVRDGILTSAKSGSNLVSNQKFQDFKLDIEFRYPEGSNSGIYLRGRYEVQIIDSKGLAPSDILFGGIYGFLTPNQMAAKSASEWQTFEITLNGRRVTIVANGIPIIQDQIIPGITGGAIDSHEGEPGPFMIQGDHGPIEIRKMTITPMN